MKEVENSIGMGLTSESDIARPGYEVESMSIRDIHFLGYRRPNLMFVRANDGRADSALLEEWKHFILTPSLPRPSDFHRQLHVPSMSMHLFLSYLFVFFSSYFFFFFQVKV